MVDNPNSGYYQSGKGSLTGFDQVNLPTGNPNLNVVGWSLEELRRFLLNQSALNFPSNEFLAQIEQLVLDHIANLDNPHETTLDQIVGNFVRQVLGNITPGTVPDHPPFAAFDAGLSLPIGHIFPATYTTNNLYRQTAGGWFADPATEDDIYGTDYVSDTPGIPLFSSMVNITPTGWATLPATQLNTTLAAVTGTTARYPVTFYNVAETPVTGQFGVNIPMTQDLQVTYTSCFFIRPAAVVGKLRIFQPSDVNNYAEVDVETGQLQVFSNTMAGHCVRNADGVLRISISFTSLVPTADNALRLVHINENAAGNGTRAGSNGRVIFAIAHPQTTTVTLDQPVMKSLSAAASTSVFALDLAKLHVPATIDQMTITLGLNLFPQIELTNVVDPTIMTFGNLLITRDQTMIRISIGGNTVFTTAILDGQNRITLSYAPTKVIFKDLANERQVVNGTFAPLSTAQVTFGPFGGYLCNYAFYAQADTQQMVEYLNDG